MTVSFVFLWLWLRLHHIITFVIIKQSLQNIYKIRLTLSLFPFNQICCLRILYILTKFFFLIFHISPAFTDWAHAIGRFILKVAMSVDVLCVVPFVGVRNGES